MLLAGKRLLVTGVLDTRSIAFAVARLAQEQGADIVLTGFGRGLRLTQASARRLPSPPDVLELDVTQPDDIRTVAKRLDERWGALDGIVHAIGYAPSSCIGGGFLDAPWDDVAVAMHVSSYSLPALGAGFSPLLRSAGSASIVGLDFDASVAWPAYDWMGVSKAALESVTRYLARDLGRHQIRVNCIAAGPIRTVAAKGIPGFDGFTETWPDRAPLGWDPADPSPVAHAAAFLFSNHSRGITGEVLHVDGGFHAVGAS